MRKKSFIISLILLFAFSSTAFSFGKIVAGGKAIKDPTILDGEWKAVYLRDSGGADYLKGQLIEGIVTIDSSTGILVLVAKVSAESIRKENLLLKEAGADLVLDSITITGKIQFKLATFGTAFNVRSISWDYDATGKGSGLEAHLQEMKKAYASKFVTRKVRYAPPIAREKYSAHTVTNKDTNSLFFHITDDAVFRWTFQK